MFVILAVNDVYSVNPKSNGCGGLAELCTMMREETESVTSGAAVSLIPGDFIAASWLAEYTKGFHVIDALNEYAGINLICSMGNHEFDYGVTGLCAVIARSRFLWLNSNVRYESGELVGEAEGAREFEVRTFRGPDGREMRVGLFALCTTDTPQLSNPGPRVVFESPEHAARGVLARLRGERCDMIVAMTHLSVAEDRHLLRTFPEIEILVGGHDHQPMTLEERGALLFKSGMDAERLVRIDCDLSRGGGRLKRVAWRYRTVADVAPDARVKAVLLEHSARAQGAVRPIARLARPLSSVGTRTGEATMAYLLVDAMACVLGAELALMNGGFLRASREYEAGYVLTDHDLRVEFPFPSPTVIVDMLPCDIYATLEDALAYVQHQLGHFPHVSRGWSVSYDAGRPPGQRVISVLRDGRPFDRNGPQAVRVATSSYLARGGDGYSHVKGAEVQSPFKEEIIQALIARYIRSLPAAGADALPVIDYELEGRIVAFEPNSTANETK